MNSVWENIDLQTSKNLDFYFDTQKVNQFLMKEMETKNREWWTPSTYEAKKGLIDGPEIAD